MHGVETERLRFRPLVPGDYEVWLELFKDAGVGRFVGLGKIATAEEQCRKWFDRAFLRIADDLGGLNVLEDKQTNELVGQCGLLMQDIEGELRMEVGYSILPKHWQKGYATEAAKKCRDHAFENNYTDALISIIHTENFKSVLVAKNNGMTLWRTTEYKGIPVDVYRITREEWERIK